MTKVDLRQISIREHRQKTLVTLSRFWPLQVGGRGAGGGGLSESVKKKYLWQKYFFQIFLNEGLV